MLADVLMALKGATCFVHSIIASKKGGFATRVNIGGLTRVFGGIRLLV